MSPACSLQLRFVLADAPPHLCIVVGKVVVEHDQFSLIIAVWCVLCHKYATGCEALLDQFRKGA